MTTHEIILAFHQLNKVNNREVEEANFVFIGEGQEYKVKAIAQPYSDLIEAWDVYITNTIEEDYSYITTKSFRVSGAEASIIDDLQFYAKVHS